VGSKREPEQETMSRIGASPIKESSGKRRPREATVAFRLGQKDMPMLGR
jgi:hypothetical protein